MSGGSTTSLFVEIWVAARWLARDLKRQSPKRDREAEGSGQIL